MIDIAAIQTAVRTWVMTGSGFDPQGVIFGRQSGRPPRSVGSNELLDAWIVVNFLTVRRHGMEWTTVEEDEEGIWHRAAGHRTLLVELTCFSYEPLGDLAAQNVLADVIDALALPSVQNALEDAQLGEASIANVTTVGAAVGAASNIEPRAIVEVYFHASAEVFELIGTYIETAQDITGTIDDVEQPPFSVSVDD